MSPPLKIGIAGAASGVGKTSLAEKLLGRFRGFGAIKYSKTALYTSVVEDPEIIEQEGKDTARLLKAGAEKVVLVKSPGGDDLAQALSYAADRLSHLRGILIEGNSAVELLKPDIVIFIGNAYAKGGAAEAVFAQADVILWSEGTALPPQGAEAARLCGNAGECVEEVARLAEMKDNLKQLLMEKTAEGRISCREARKLAEELKVSYRRVGQAADEMSIKITACELGCF